MRKLRNYSVIVGISVLTIMVTFSTQIEAIEPGSAIGIWLLDEGDGTTINDSSGNNNHGELQGGSWVETPDGRSVLSLNGQNDRVVIPDSDSLYADKAWTITAWVNVNSGETGFGHIVGKRAASGAIANYAFRTSGSGTGWEAYYSRDGWKGAWNQSSVRKGIWLYMTATYDGEDTIKIYENAVQIGLVSGLGGPSPRNTSEVNIGGWTNNTSETLNGMLYDVAVFNVALSEAEIKDLMDNGVETILLVDPAGKLSTTWANIKNL